MGCAGWPRTVGLTRRRPYAHWMRRFRRFHRRRQCGRSSTRIWLRAMAGCNTPHALRRRSPNAPVAWGWQWLFPQSHRWQDPATGQQGRHDLDPSLIQTALRGAVLAVGIHKSAKPTRFSSLYRWISGPITTVRHERMSPKAIAVTRARWTAWMWFTESCRRGSEVLGNYP